MSYNKELEDRIDHYLIANEELVKSNVLGWVGWLLNGHMCFGIYNELLIIRLDIPLARALLEKQGVEYFQQADQTPGKVLSIEPNIFSEDEVLFKFIERSMKFTSSLPPKEDENDQRIQSLS